MHFNDFVNIVKKVIFHPLVNIGMLTFAFVVLVGTAASFNA